MTFFYSFIEYYIEKHKIGNFIKYDNIIIGITRNFLFCQHFLVHLKIRREKSFKELHLNQSLVVA